jgi:hypothetical protein
MSGMARRSTFSDLWLKGSVSDKHDWNVQKKEEKNPITT